jgi:dynamin family protein
MNQTTQSSSPPARKPRLALMGEFSAGKSTLSNLLLGADPLPVQVTATRLPPVWISYGENAATREDLDGNSIAIDINRLETVPLEETRMIRLCLKSDILRLCDLIDMPGISDPNMDAGVWQAVIGEADHVIWCTHATQAWRQSEAAVWESLPEHLRQQSLLLLTRFDKLLTPRDRNRVVKRVRRETDGLFGDVFPVSLTEALVSGEDRQAWENSGAEPFVLRLIDLLTQKGGSAGEAQERGAKEESEAPASQPAETEHSSSIRVMPSRVRMKPGGQKRPRCRPQGSVALPPEQTFLDVPENA